MREANTFVGSKITSTGLVAKIGKYLLVITEKDEGLEEFDFTLIPLHAKIHPIVLDSRQRSTAGFPFFQPIRSGSALGVPA